MFFFLLYRVISFAQSREGGSKQTTAQRKQEKLIKICNGLENFWKKEGIISFRTNNNAGLSRMNNFAIQSKRKGKKIIYNVAEKTDSPQEGILI
jgi:hypothetical protein